MANSDLSKSKYNHSKLESLRQISSLFSTNEHRNSKLSRVKEKEKYSVLYNYASSGSIKGDPGSTKPTTSLNQADLEEDSD